MVNITVWEWTLYVFVTPIAWSCGKVTCKFLPQVIIRSMVAVAAMISLVSEWKYNRRNKKRNSPPM